MRHQTPRSSHLSRILRAALGSQTPSHLTPWIQVGSAKQPTRHPQPTTARPRRSSWWYVSPPSQHTLFCSMKRVVAVHATARRSGICVFGCGGWWWGGVARAKTKCAPVRDREHRRRHWTLDNTRHLRHTPLIHHGHLATTAHADADAPDAACRDEKC